MSDIKLPFFHPTSWSIGMIDTVTISGKGNHPNPMWMLGDMAGTKLQEA
jgi:hypothetical protein